MTRFPPGTWALYNDRSKEGMQTTKETAINGSGQRMKQQMLKIGKMDN